MSISKDAITKLRAEEKTGTYDRYAGAMKKPVLDQLVHFCEQNEEFAEAVMQGGSFAECMKAVAKGVGSSISDLEAYRRAVQFYFPGAEIQFHMTVDLIGAAAGRDPSAAPQDDSGKKAVILDLTDFL